MVRRPASVTVATTLSVVATGATNFLFPVGIQTVAGLSALGLYTLVSIPAVAGLAIQRQVLSQTVVRGANPVSVPGLLLFQVMLIGTATSASFAMALVNGADVWLLLVAALTPVSLFQDFWRFTLFGQSRPVVVLGSDLIWLVGPVAGYVLVKTRGLGNSALIDFVALSVGTAACSLLVIAVCARLRTTDATDSVAGVGAVAAEAVSIFGLAQVSQLVIGLAVSPTTVGEFRSMQLLLTPVTLMASLLVLIVIPKMNVTNRRSVLNSSAACCSLIGSAGVAIIVFWLVNPLGILSSLGFAEFNSAVWVLAVLVLAGVISSFSAIYMVRIRVQQSSRRWLPIRVAGAILDPLISIPGVLIIGTAGLGLGSLSAGSVSLFSLVIPDLMKPKEKS